MPDPISALIGASIGGSILGASAQEEAAAGASAAQIEATRMQIESQERALAEARELMAPFVGAGESALAQQMALAGLAGPEAERVAIQQVEQSPFLQAQVEAGEEALLQRASATGGLRGGNIQAALAQYRPQMVSQAIEAQYGKLGGLTRLGQAAAAGQVATGMAGAGAIGQAYAQRGAAQAGAALAAGQAQAGMYGGIGSAIGQGIMMQQLGLFGGGGAGLGGISVPAAFSDKRLKKNINKIGTLGEYNLYSWEWNDKGKEIAGDTPTVGVIAQEVMEISPELVSIDSSGYMMVDYNKIYNASRKEG